VAEDIFSHEKYAAKFEEKSSRSLLENEYNVLKEFQGLLFFFFLKICFLINLLGEIGFPSVKYFDKSSNKEFNILIITLLGSDVFNKYEEDKSLFTVTDIANIGFFFVIIYSQSLFPTIRMYIFIRNPNSLSSQLSSWKKLYTS
jgi:hypothetical protein